MWQHHMTHDKFKALKFVVFKLCNACTKCRIGITGARADNKQIRVWFVTVKDGMQYLALIR